MKRIAAMALAALCAGCAVTADLLRLDPVTCAAEVHHDPYCIVGIAVFVKERF